MSVALWNARRDDPRFSRWHKGWIGFLDPISVPRGPRAPEAGDRRGGHVAAGVMAASFPISLSIRIMPGPSPRLLEYQIQALERMTLQHELATAPA